MTDQKRVAICCVGQLRNGRFLMKNQRYWVGDYFKSLGYLVDFYLYTDRYNISKVTNPSRNGFIYRITNVTEDEIYEYYNYMKEGTAFSKIMIEDNKSVININGDLRIVNDNYFIGQIEKYHNLLKMVNETNVQYDIIIRHRFDTVFSKNPQIPLKNELIQSNITYLNYISDHVHIFNGEYFQNVFNTFNNVNLATLSDYFNSLNYVVETFFNELFIQSGLELATQDNLLFTYTEQSTMFIKNANWKYYEDFLNQSALPYKYTELIKILHLRKNLPSVTLGITSVPNNSINLYDFIDSTDPLEFQKLAISAFQPNKIVCSSTHPLYEFINQEFSHLI